MDYMEQALALARLALGQVSPNPAVGAVVTKNGSVIGQGYTRPPGSCHAEISALEQAGNIIVFSSRVSKRQKLQYSERVERITDWDTIQTRLKDVHSEAADVAVYQNKLQFNPEKHPLII